MSQVSKSLTEQHSEKRLSISSIIISDLVYGTNPKETPMYLLIGKENENEEIGLKRELEEEFNIKASVENYLTESFYEYDSVKINLKAYFVKDFLGDIKLTDHDKVEWINIDELKNYDFAPADIPINDYLVKNGI